MFIEREIIRRKPEGTFTDPDKISLVIDIETLIYGSTHKEWFGDIHYMDNGYWMTGETHTDESLYVEIDETIEPTYTIPTVYVPPKPTSISTYGTIL